MIAMMNSKPNQPTNQERFVDGIKVIAGEEPSSMLLQFNQVDVDDEAQSNTSVAVQVHHPASGRRRRRDVYHLYKFMTCTTPCDPLSYTNYGCYCGFLGSGDAVDGLDRFHFLCSLRHVVFFNYCHGKSLKLGSIRCKFTRLLES